MNQEMTASGGDFVSNIRRAISGKVMLGAALLGIGLSVFVISISLTMNSHANAVAVATPMMTGGDGHSVALKNDGTVWSWGANGSGQLGDGTTSSRSTPVQVSGLSNAISIAGGGPHSVALMNDGTVWAWGFNSSGQLGDGTTTARNTPTQVSGLSGIISIAGGSTHSTALKSDGTVWSWGSNWAGQLGDGTTTSRSTPVQVIGLANVVSIASGNGHTMVIKNDSTVWSLGSNNLGQLGDGTTTQRTTPVQVNGLSGIIAIAAGEYHSAALKSDGTVWCWGNNGSGELGDGTTTNRYSPVQVSGLTGVVAIRAGNALTVALKADGTVWTFGYNHVGQLGDGTTTSRSAPVQVVGLSSIIAIGNGDFHTIALKSDGTVWAFGYGANGQLGDGTDTHRSLPVQVTGLNLSPPATPPSKATIVAPGNGTQTADTSSVFLQWANGGGATSYDVYFGTNPTPGAGDSKGNQAGTSYASGALIPNTTYYWRIDAKNATATTTGEVWNFTTPPQQTAPRKAQTPTPAYGTINNLTSGISLKWENGGGAASYDVYFGTSANPGAGQFIGNQSTRSYAPGALLPNTTYYWRIDAKNAIGTATGDVWQFKTLAAPQKAATPMPQNNMIKVGTSYGSINWQNGGDATSYDVYFGTASSPGAGQFKGNQSGTSYALGTLLPSTTYYWRIDAKNTSGTTTGDIWTFTTVSGAATLSTQPLSDAYHVNTNVTTIAADGVAAVKITVTASVQGALTVTVPNQAARIVGTLSTTRDGTQSNSIAISSGTSNAGQFVYTFYYTSPADFNDQAGTTTSTVSRTVALSGAFTATTGEITNTSIPLTIARPPVVLVHGLWANATTWDYFKKSISQSLTGLSVSTLQYPHYSSFPDNAPEVYLKIFQTLRTLRNNGWAVEQVDYVGHSMGGVLGRMLASSVWIDGTTNRTRINKLITIHSPLMGSSAASRLMGKNPALLGSTLTELTARNKLYEANPLAKGNEFCAAVLDLQAGSTAVSNLPAVSDAVVYMIGGTTSAKRNMTAAKYVAFNGLVTTISAIGTVFQTGDGVDGWDGIVAQKSQVMNRQAGQPGVTFDIFEHTQALTENSTVNSVIGLLNTPLSSGEFIGLPANSTALSGVTGLAVQPQSIARAAAASETFTVIEDRTKFRIASPVSGDTLLSGRTVGCTIVTAGITPDTVFLGATWKPGQSQTLGAAPWTFDLALDNSHLGNGTIIAIGIVNDQMYIDTIPVVVTTDSPIRSLVIDQTDIEISSGSSYSLTVWGDFSDTENLKYLMGQSLFPVTYTSDNENVARVTDTGLIIAVGPGIAHIKAKVNPEAIVTVSVSGGAASAASSSNYCVVQMVFGNRLLGLQGTMRGARDAAMRNAIGRIMTSIYYEHGVLVLIVFAFGTFAVIVSIRRERAVKS